MAWLYDLPPTLHFINGKAEILGGLDLILPGVTRIQIRLISLAALGLSLVVVGAMVYHATQGEYQNIAMNVILLITSAFLHTAAGNFSHWMIAALKLKIYLVGYHLNI